MGNPVRSGNLLLVGRGAAKMAKALEALSQTPKGKHIGEKARQSARRTTKMLAAAGVIKKAK